MFIGSGITTFSACFAFGRNVINLRESQKVFLSSESADKNLVTFEGVLQKEECPRGSACPCAHNVFEYWLLPSRCVCFLRSLDELGYSFIRWLVELWIMDPCRSVFLGWWCRPRGRNLNKRILILTNTWEFRQAQWHRNHCRVAVNSVYIQQLLHLTPWVMAFIIVCCKTCHSGARIWKVFAL